MAIALGIDFENITHTPAYRSLDSQIGIDTNLEVVTKQILELFEQFDVSATFFVVAEIAQDHPELIRQIAEHGHEIASHTVSHCSLVDIGPEKLSQELRRSKTILENQINDRVRGIRAPTCRINDQVYRDISSAGYEFSSSVMSSLPIPGFYSHNYSFSEPRKISTEAGEITEIPLSAHPLLRLPLSGAWIRLLGQRYTLQGIRATLKRNNHVVTYSHPWEFTGLLDTPLPFRSRFRTGSWFAETYESILELDAEFCTVSDLVEEIQPSEIYWTSSE